MDHTPNRNPPPSYPGPPSYANYEEEEFTPTHSVVGNGSTLRLLGPATEDSSYRASVVPSTLSSVDTRDFASSSAVAPSSTGSRLTGMSNAQYQRGSDVESLLDEAVQSLQDHRSAGTALPRLNTAFATQRDRNIPRKDVSSTSSSPTKHSPSPLTRSYQPSTTSLPLHSRAPSIIDDAPDIRPPISAASSYFNGYRPVSPSRLSRERSWSPSRSSMDYSRPPASTVSYEPQDLNGSPRPGTPSSQYGGSPRRPLPPKPLFAAGTASRDDEDGDMTSIPIHDDDEEPDDDESDDVFNDRKRPGLKERDSFMTQSTYTAEDYDDKFEAFGSAPDGQQTRRGVRPAQQAKKEVRLVNGELILECKIPTILYSFLPRRDDVEFTHMRYTAVTCDPDDFNERGYKLRQNYGNTHRETELFICITMYNENEIDFTRTMHGVMRNIAHFCSRTKSRTWGKDGWQKIVVCIISDGRAKVHPRTLDALAAMGVYQEGIAKNSVNQKEVTAHVYEYTTQVSLDSELKFKGAEKGIVPCQLIFCLKEKNAKKLNSHRWFFNAFGRALNPNVCILLDVGTKPGNDSLYHLWKAFDQDSNVAGAAGEIIAGKGKAWLGLLNPLVASQNFEYKMSNILDKPLESVFGYITVLPGALSAYRYHALQNDETGHGPLSQYFKGETLHGQNADVFTANMYLAEDRILCWELVAKRKERWVLKYVKSAKGETDVPDAVPEFISQRRRWLNGAFFAAVYSLLHFRQIWSTDHTIPRKILLHIEFLYQFVSLLFTFFSLANFYLTFYFIAGSLADEKLDPFGHHIGAFLFAVLRYACVLLICVQFILSMGNRPQGAKRMYTISMTVYSIIMAYTTFCAMFIVIKQLKDPSTSFTLGNNVFTNLIVSTASTVGLYFLMSFMYLDPWHMFTSSAQYFAMLPSYICTLQVYAFCNTHDITWGTKGDNVASTDLGAAKSSKGAKAGTVEVDMPAEQLDIDSAYDIALRNLRDRIEVPSAPTSEAQLQEDYYRAVRTYVVVTWLTANAVMAMAISEAYSTQNVSDNFYLKFILWAVAALAFFRACGSTTFGLLNVIHSIAEGRVKWSNKWEGRGGSVISAGSSKRSGGGGGFMSKLKVPGVPGWAKKGGRSVGSKFSKILPGK